MLDRLKRAKRPVKHALQVRGLIEERPHGVRLGGGVGEQSAAAGLQCGLLGPRILLAGAGVAAQQIAQRKVVRPALAAELHEMQVEVVPIISMGGAQAQVTALRDTGLAEVLVAEDDEPIDDALRRWI